VVTVHPSEAAAVLLLSQAAEALRYLGAGHTRGKVVVTIPATTANPPARSHG
jgi:hypothetical protein